MAFSITGLVYITNHFPATISFENTEHGGNDRKINANEAKGVSNAWIPWCDNEGDFAKKHMSIKAVGLKLYFWQHGDAVYYSREAAWSKTAAEIPGYSGINQSVSWVVDADGKPSQAKYFA